MSSTREAIKSSLLQLKTTRQTGTFRKKTRPFYGDASWVVLCVHDDKIPILEWYHTAESIADHRPIKVIDLLYASHVTRLEDPRSFSIGLSEFESKELVALQPVTASEWVEAITATLKRLSILPIASNEPKPGPSKERIQEEERFQAIRKLHMEMPPDPILSQRMERPESLRTSHVSFEHRPCPRPSLPPRPSEPLVARRSGSFSDLPTNGCLSPGDDHSVTPHILSPLYDTPRNEFVHTVATPPRSPRSTRMNGRHSHHRLSHSIYDTLSPSRLGSSPLQSTISTNSLCSSLSSELRLSTILPSSDVSEYDHVRDDFHAKVKYVSLNLSVIVEHVLFVEIHGRIWVGGWSEVQDKQLSSMLSFGDELVEVEGHEVRGMTNIPQLFYNVSMPGTPISLVFRPTPYGTTFTLMKPIKKDKDIGIRLHKHKNRIGEIFQDSSSARRGLSSTIVSAFHGEHQSSAVITEVAGKRLNPFARNDQFFQRYEELRDGVEFSLIIHPHDFMKEMKHQLASAKSYKAYLSLS